VTGTQGTGNSVEFDIGIDLSSYTALLDWYVFNGSFRLSGGIIAMDNKVDLEARPTENIEIGDVDFTPDEVGYLYGSIENDEVVPYVGIGWGNPLTHHRRWGFTCDFGVAFTSSPDVTLTAIGGTKPPELKEELCALVKYYMRDGPDRAVPVLIDHAQDGACRTEVHIPEDGFISKLPAALLKDRDVAAEQIDNRALRIPGIERGHIQVLDNGGLKADTPCVSEYPVFCDAEQV